MEIITTAFEVYDHLEFRLHFDETIPTDDVAWLVSMIARSVSEGAAYGDGEVIDLGSLLFRVELSEQLLVLLEPDFAAVPIVWHQGVTDSLRLLRLQKDIAQSVGLKERFDCPAICESVIPGVDVNSDVDELIMERADAEGSDSGWFIGNLSSPLNLRRSSVYEAIVHWPRSAGFMALTNGTKLPIIKYRQA